MITKRIPNLFCAAILLLLVIAAPGATACADVQSVIEVTTTSDELNTDGDCSLREAIQAANTNTAVDDCPAGSGADTISIPAGLYTLTLAPSGEDANLGGDLDILQDLTLTGDNQSNTILDGNNADRILHLFASTVHISGLTLRNGNIAAGDSGGGAIFVDGNSTLVLERSTLTGNTSYNIGGAVDSTGTIRAYDVLFTNNTSDRGGALSNLGTLIIDGAAFVANHADLTGGGFDNSENATLNNVTFSDNTSAFGGGMFNDGTEVFLINVTFANNNTAIRNNGVIRFLNTIVANSSGDNCSGIGEFFSLDYNIDSGSTCGFSQASDQANQDPLLGTLGNHEGPTPVYPLLDGSPAIDMGSNQNCPTTDQRGAYRPADGNSDSVKTCDIGAFEFNGVFPSFIFMPIINR